MNIKLTKALRLLDIEKYDEAEKILLELSENSDIYTSTSANCILGELYFEDNNFQEAKKYMEKVKNVLVEDDILDYEKSIATEILDKLET